MSAPVSVTAVGLACPLGLSALAASAAIRADINRFEELRYSDDEGEPIVGSALSLLPAHCLRRERWLALAGCSLRNLLGDQIEALAGLPLLVAISDPSFTHHELCAALSRDLGVALSPAQVRAVVGGPSMGLHLIAQARELIARGARACVVLAADSLIDAAALLGLTGARRLALDSNPDGLRPGEAAACVLIEPATSRAWAAIRGAGSGHEPARLDNDAPMRADGLAQASLAALADAELAAHELSFRVSDATGESFHFKEQALLPGRILRRPIAHFPAWVPAAQLGHVGAAAGLCGVVIASIGLVRGYAPGPRALVCAGADDGDRAALVIERA